MANTGPVKQHKRAAMGQKINPGSKVTELAPVPNGAHKMENHEHRAPAWEKGTKMKGFPSARKHPANTGK